MQRRGTMDRVHPCRVIAHQWEQSGLGASGSELCGKLPIIHMMIFCTTPALLATEDDLTLLRLSSRVGC